MKRLILASFQVLWAVILMILGVIMALMWLGMFIMVAGLALVLFLLPFLPLLLG